MTYQFCQCHDETFHGQYFIEKLTSTYQRTDRSGISYVIQHFNYTKQLTKVSGWDENDEIPSREYEVLCQFSHLDELLSTYPELFL